MDFLQTLGIERPIVQAGMGGGLSRRELAAAVSEAGGLGTVGFLEPDQLRAEIIAARKLTARPIAANLLLPFARRRHFQAAWQADVVVTFWGKPHRHTSGTWIHQCGSVNEALAACRAGANAVIAQGVESGGHVRGTTPTLELLERVRAAVGPNFPVLAAGGVAERSDVAELLDAGAVAAVSGTRFLMSEESGAHALYKERLAAAEETVLTELFGSGWPAPHRVVRNDATDRWLAGDPRGPRAMRLLNEAAAPVLTRLPSRFQARAAVSQRPDRPFFGPFAPTAGGPANLVEAGPLYAGESIARIGTVRPAAELVRDLSP
jgi:NAD(P)H-dependent flavin oxidoreductase YrpB (nitropropane dioxygenase family)